MKHPVSRSVALAVLLGCGLLAQNFTRSVALNFSESPSLFQAFGAVAADLNGDGRPDLAVTCGSNVHLFIADDRRILRWREKYSAAGTRLLGLVAADLTGDGHIDLATVDLNGGAVILLEGHGDGTFRPAPPIPVDAAPAYLAAADLNGDGRQELVVSHQGGVISVLTADADGTFRVSRAAENIGQVTNENLVVADFNRDGVPDLAVGHQGGAWISLYFGKGDGTFSSESRLPTERSLSTLAVADFNQDGLPDLAAGDYRASQIYVFSGDGMGGFGSPSRYPGSAMSLLAGDWNLDGKPDLVASDFNNSIVRLWLGDGQGFPGSAKSYLTGFSPRNLASADFDGDGVPDLAVLNWQSGNIDLFLGSAGGSLEEAYTLGPLDPVGLTAGDFHRTGSDEVAVVSRGAEQVLILHTGEDGTWQAAEKLPVGRRPSSIVQADLNGDGVPDLAVGHELSSEIRLFLGKPEGGFGEPIRVSAPASASLAAGDLNGDGRPDLVAVPVGAPFVSVAISLGEGRFESWQQVRAESGVLAARVFDWDKDGVPDIVFGTFTGLFLLRGSGGGQFQPPEKLADGYFRALAIADLDRDGKPDLIALDSNDGRVMVALGRGSGPNTLATYQSPFNSLLSAVVADFNRDGYPDIAVLHFATLGPAVSIYSGTADGALEPSFRVFGLPGYAESLAAADINRDGAPDLVFSGPTDTLGTAWNDAAGELLPRDPAPAAPVDNAEIPQNLAEGCVADSDRGSGYSIPFRWEPAVNGELVSGYELQVTREASAASLLDAFFARVQSEFTLKRCRGVIGDGELDKWQWRVRARYASGGAGPWSAAAAFHFAPCRLADGRQCGRPGGMPSDILESLLADRSRHTATLLPGGDVLIAGGLPEDMNSSTEIYRPAAGRFGGGSSMTLGRSDHTATLLRNGKVLIAGGSGLRATADLYDPATGVFEPAGAIANRLRRHAATLLADGRVLITGGNSLPYYYTLQSAQIYDPATGRFTPAADMNVARASHTATLLNTGEVLLVGDSISGMQPAELFNPSTGEFRTIGQTVAPRSGHTATLLKSGQVLLVGSEGSGAELYDPVAIRFEALPPMNQPRYAHTATLLADGSVLIAGGMSAGNSIAGVERFDPAARRFESLPPLAMPRGFHTATLLPDGSVLVVGGFTETAARSAELYTPPAR